MTTALTAASAIELKPAGEPIVLNVWPGTPPASVAGRPAEKTVHDGRIEVVSNVSVPTISVYRPPADNANGTAVIVCPGGGYNILAWDLEGTEVGGWLNSLGVTAIVLKYRVPVDRDAAGPFPPLMDAQRAVSLVRGKAADWKLNPARIGILGFSAGGNLSAQACTHFDHREYDHIDAVDDVSCRPDFAVLIYPAWLLNEGTQSLAAKFPVTPRTPPMFLVHTSEDVYTAESSAAMYLALRHAGVSAELHVFATGAHGYGLRPTTQPVTRWPALCETWLRGRGLLPARHDGPPATRDAD